MIYISSRKIEEGKENKQARERENIHIVHTTAAAAYSGGRIRHTSFTCCCGPFFIIISPPFFVLNIERRLFFLDTTTVKSVFSKRSSSTREDFSLSCECIACACHKSSVSSLFLCFSALCVRLMMMRCGFFSCTWYHTLKEIERRPAPCSRVGICIFLSPFLSLYAPPAQ